MSLNKHEISKSHLGEPEVNAELQVELYLDILGLNKKAKKRFKKQVEDCYRELDTRKL